MITEWGHNSENNAGYDGNFAAAHTLAVATELEGFIRRAFVFEIQDGKDPNGKEYWGRWGLFTHSSHGAKAKPRYQALKLLGRLGPQKLLLTGKGSWVKGIATQNAESIQVLLVNYDPRGAHYENVPVKIQNLVDRAVQVETVKLNGTSSMNDYQLDNLSLDIVVPLAPNQAVLLNITPKTVQQ